MEYILASDDKKAFAFRLSSEVLYELEYHVGRMLTECVDHTFYSLDYLNKVLGK